MKETRELALRGITIDAGSVSQISRTIVAKTAKALQERIVDWTKRALGAEAEIVRLRLEVYWIVKVVTADVVVGKCRAVISFG